MTERPPFVGRRQELAVLRGALADARRGRGSVVLISGALGIGKSRLVEEFITQARADDVLVGTGRYYEHLEMPRYVGVREALWELASDARVRCRITPATPHARPLARLGQEFGELAGIEPEDSGAPSDTDPYPLWRAIGSFLSDAASVAPVVLALDDLHWADRDSLDLLSFLGRQVRAVPAVIIAIGRDDDVPRDHPIVALAADLARTEGSHSVRLREFTPREVGALAAALVGGAVLDEFTHRLHKQTGGNPLLVSEVVRHLVDERRLRPEEAPVDLAEDVPQGLRDVIARRVAGLSENCQRLVSLASIFESAFDLPLLEATGVLEAEPLLSALDEALRCAILRDGGGSRFTFTHPLVRGIVYDALSPAERMTAHRQAAAALERKYGKQAEARAREIASHLLRAGGLAGPEQVARYCLVAAQQARRLFSFEEARSLLEGALDAAARVDGAGEMRAQMLLELGYAETALGRPDEAIGHYRDALSTYRALGLEDDALNARRWLAATLARYGRWQETLDVTQGGLAGRPEAKTYAYIGLVGSHALALAITGHVAEAQPWVNKLLDLAFDTGTRAVANHTAAGWNSWGAGDPRLADGHFRAARALFAEEGLDGTASGVALDHAVVAYHLGNVDESRAAEAEAERLASAAGRVSVLADLHAFRSLVAAHRGEWQQALDEREQWRRISATAGGTTIYRQFAERSEALELLWRDGPDAARGALVTPHPLDNQPLFAALLAEAGDADGALSALEPVLERLPPNGRGLFWLSSALPAASVLSSLGRSEATGWLDALDLYRGGLMSWYLVDLELARIAARAGRWNEAHGTFDRAAARCERDGLRPLAAQVCWHRALALRGHGEAALRRQAGGLMRQAYAMFAELGLEHMREQVGRVLVRPSRGRPASAGPEHLTRRESAVLSLLAEGKSNREIAAALFIKERTVARHLENIYGKLGVGSRGAALALAFREGLLRANGSR